MIMIMKVKARERFKIGYSITKQQIEMSEKDKDF